MWRGAFLAACTFLLTVCLFTSAHYFPVRCVPPHLPFLHHRSERVKTLLGMEENTVIEYKLHRDSLRDRSTYKNTDSFVFQPTPSPKFSVRASPHLPPGGLEPLPEAAEKVKERDRREPGTGVLTPESPAFLPSSAAAAAAGAMATLSLS